MSTKEQTPNTDRRPTPTPEELSEIKSRVSKMRLALEYAGLQNSPKATTGDKLSRYLAKTSGHTAPQEMTVAKWDALFCTLDGLLKNDPRKAVETVEAVDDWSISLEEQIKECRAEIERNERTIPHAQRAKE